MFNKSITQIFLIEWDLERQSIYLLISNPCITSFDVSSVKVYVEVKQKKTTFNCILVCKIIQLSFLQITIPLPTIALAVFKYS